MSGEYSMNPIVQQGTYSDGVLPMNCIELWNQYQYKNEFTQQPTSPDYLRRKGHTYEIIIPLNQGGFEIDMSRYGVSLYSSIIVSGASISRNDWSSQVTENMPILINFIKCLSLIKTLSTIYPEGLEEASETLNHIVEYHRECQGDLQQIQQSSLARESGTINGTILSSQVRPPLTLDFE